MNSQYLTLISVLSLGIGAIGRRMAGGVLSQWLNFDITTQVARLVWGLCLTGIAFMSGADWITAVAIAPATVLGSALFGFWGAMSAGNQPGRTVWKDSLLLAAHGVGGMLFIMGVFLSTGYFLNTGYTWSVLFMLVAGLTCPGAYILAWKSPIDAPALGCLSNDPPPTAELIWGAIVGLAVVLTVIFK